MDTPEFTISSALLSAITNQFQLSPVSIHGLGHWKHVEAIGRHLSASTGAEVAVVVHFAYLHDSRRINENDDTGHGKRAAEYIRDLARKGYLELRLDSVNRLLNACEIHSISTSKPTDRTIMTCLDADRLDLIRLGIRPEPVFLFSEEAKRLAGCGEEAIRRIAEGIPDLYSG